MTDSLESLRELRHLLQRLGAQQAARFWSSASLVFASNFAGGTATGAGAFILAGVLLGLDIHRGENSAVVHVVRAVQSIIVTIRGMVEQELP